MTGRNTVKIRNYSDSKEHSDSRELADFLLSLLVSKLRDSKEIQWQEGISRLNDYLSVKELSSNTEIQ